MSFLPLESLKAALYMANVGIFILDQDKEILFLNNWAKKHLFLDNVEIDCLPFLSVFPELKNTRLYKSVEGCLRNGHHYILSHTLNKSPFPFFENKREQEKNNRMDQYIQLIPIPEYLCMIQITDVTQQVNRENLLRAQMESAQKSREAAQHASLAKSNFLASMSHEIRTPLNSILGMAEILSETELNIEQLSYLKTLKNSGKALFNIINDILDFSRIEAEKFDLDESIFSISKFLEDTVSIFILRAREKGISLQVELADLESDFILGDEARLQQIFINLLGNSIKFTSNGSILWKIQSHSISEAEKKLVFEVKDTGIGIPENKQKGIFESFTQVDTSTTRLFGGTGLGLAITKKIIGLMKGKIWLESKPGVGSSFFVEIPWTIPKIEGKSKSALDTRGKRVPEPDSFPTMNLLIAEDSPENVFLLKAFFRKYSFHLTIATNGQEAVDIVLKNSNRFSAIIMDMQMPVMDGIEATQLIRNWEEETKGKRQVPIVALTANVLKEDIDKAFKAGCTSYLTKPVKKEDLLRLLYLYAIDEEDIT